MLGGLGGMNPAQMKKLMQQMGIKNVDIPAKRVVIEKEDGLLVIENPQVVMIEMGGNKTFQVNGDVQEKATTQEEKSDVEIVAEKTGCTKQEAEKALANSNGDIAEAIMSLEAGK